MNLFEGAHEESRRVTQTTQLTQLPEANEAGYRSNTLELSNIAQSQVSKSSSQDNHLKPTRSKALINSYLNIQRIKNSSVEKSKQTQEQKEKEYSKGIFQKLTLISNTKDKQNKASRANSKEKIHLTTLHPNIPHSSMINSRVQRDKENIQSERDVFLNISITNQSERTKRQDAQLLQKIHQLQSELSLAHSQLSLTRLALEQKESMLIKSQGQMRQLNDRISMLQVKCSRSKEGQGRLEELERENEKLKREEKRLKDQYQLLKNSVSLRNERTNQAVLNYECEITELKKEIDYLKWQAHLESINTNVVIRELEMEKETIRNSSERSSEQHRSEINCLEGHLRAMQEDAHQYKLTIQGLQESIRSQNYTLEMYQSQRKSIHFHAEKYNALLAHSQALERDSESMNKRAEELSGALQQKQTQLQRCNLTIQSLARQKQLLSESLETLGKRLQYSNRQIQCLGQYKEGLISEIESLKKERQIQNKHLEALGRENTGLQLKAEACQRSLAESASIHQSFRRKFDIEGSIETPQKAYIQVQKKMQELALQNNSLRLQIQGLLEQKMTNEKLIIRIEASIEERLSQQSARYERDYEELYQKHMMTCQKLQKMNRKRSMQRALLSQSNHFHEEIYLKCQQIYHAT